MDIFFVISGYLISGIIFRDLLAGNFSFAEFYRRRVKRIIPNLLLVMTVVLALGWFIMTDDEFSQLSKHLRASAFFYQDINLLKGSGYWDESSQLLPLLHLWSLSIEEQFYILFPLICVLLWKFKSVKVMGVFVLLMTVASLAACLHAHLPERAFYWPLYRFWELGAGIVIAYLERFEVADLRRLPSKARELMSAAGFALIGAVLIIAAGKDCVVNRALAVKPLVFIGLISYSLYLWHWPFLAYLRLNQGIVPPWQLLAALGLTFIVSTVVYFTAENPMRHSQSFAFITVENPLRSRVWKSGRFGAATVLILLLCLFTGLQKAVIHADRAQPRQVVERWGDFLTKTREWIDFGRAPSVATDGVKIITHKAGELPAVLFVGDSHTEQYFYRLQKLSREYSLNAGQLFISRNHNWPDMTRKLDAVLSHREIKSVVFAAKWGHLDLYHFGLKRLTGLIKTLADKHPDKKFYAILDAPWDGGGRNEEMGTLDIATHLSRLFGKPEDYRHFIVPLPKAQEWRKGNETVVQELSSRVTIISTEEAVCPQKRCDIGERYRDDDHLKPKWLEDHAVWVDRIFQEVEP